MNCKVEYKETEVGVIPKDWNVMRIKDIVSDKKYRPPAREILHSYFNEIIELVENTQDKLQPKVAFEVICKRHNLEEKVSYSSFKRFYRTHCQKQLPAKITCRIESPPARIIQVDYAKMGLLYDPMLKRNRSVYAFIATLGNSRHKYVEFVYKQDQKSFVRSHVHLMHYFNGIPEIIIIDNLKSGIIKPDLYDPKLNDLLLFL